MFNEMEKNLITVLKKHDKEYIKLHNSKQLKIVHDMFVYGLITKDDVLGDCKLLRYAAIFYDVNGESILAKEYYTLAANKGCTVSMEWLYKNEGYSFKRLAIAKMGADKNCDWAHLALGNDYGTKWINSIYLTNYTYNGTFSHNKMIEHYKQAAEMGNKKAMCHLGKHYRNIQTNITNCNICWSSGSLMHQYYNKAIDMGCDNAMVQYAHYYHHESDYTNMIKYLEMAVSKDNIEAMCELGIHYHKEQQNDFIGKNLAIKYLSMAIVARNGVDACQLHYGSVIKILSCYDDTKDKRIGTMLNYYGGSTRLIHKHKCKAIIEITENAKNDKSHGNDMIVEIVDAMANNYKDKINNIYRQYKEDKEKDEQLIINALIDEANDDAMTNITIDAINDLGNYYEKQNDIKNMFKYRMMAIKAYDTTAVDDMISYYKKKNDDDYVDIFTNYKSGVSEGNKQYIDAICDHMNNVMTYC